MEGNGKIMKCATSWIWLTVERNGWKFGICGPRNSLCRVLFGSGHLSSVWGHSVHFAKFPMLRLSKGYCSHNFYSISTKLYRKHGNQGEYMLLAFLALCQKLQIWWHSEIFVNTGPYGAGNFKVLLLLHPMSLKLYEDIGYHGRIQAVTFLGSQPNLKKNVALWNFNMGVNILKMAVRRAK